MTRQHFFILLSVLSLVLSSIACEIKVPVVTVTGTVVNPTTPATASTTPTLAANNSLTTATQTVTPPPSGSGRWLMLTATKERP